MGAVRYGIDRSEFTAILDRMTAEGYPLVVDEKAGWVKVFGPAGPNGPRLYIARRDVVRQVDLSGFGADFEQGPGCPVLGPEAKNGSVTGHLNLLHDDVLDNFEMLLMVVAAAAPAAPKAARGPADKKIITPKRKGAAAPAPTERPRLTPDQIAQRKVDAANRDAVAKRLLHERQLRAGLIDEAGEATASDDADASTQQ